MVKAAAQINLHPEHTWENVASSRITQFMTEVSLLHTSEYKIHQSKLYLTRPILYHLLILVSTKQLYIHIFLPFLFFLNKALHILALFHLPAPTSITECTDFLTGHFGIVSYLLKRGILYVHFAKCLTKRKI